MDDPVYQRSWLRRMGMTIVTAAFVPSVMFGGTVLWWARGIESQIELQAHTVNMLHQNVERVDEQLDKIETTATDLALAVRAIRVKQDHIGDGLRQLQGKRRQMYNNPMERE